jgi:hypothetical protein
MLRSVEAGRPDNDATLREAIVQAASLSHPAASTDPVKIWSRDDLDKDLTAISDKAATNVAFYQVEQPVTSAVSNNGSVWAAVSGDSPKQSYGLFDFENSAAPDQSSQEFNRLVSQLPVKIGNENATDMAHFFLDCCLGGAGEIVANEDVLHHTIEREYLQIYGNVWRALDSGVQWWQEYTASGYQFPPPIEIEDGAYRINIERVVTGYGVHPQLQQFQIEIFRDGKVHVMQAEAVFPKETRWLSFDSRESTAPQFHSPQDEIDRLKGLLKH